MTEHNGIKSGENYQAWSVNKLSSQQFWKLENNKLRHQYLASLAHLAPSTHNTQPWLFRYSDKNDETEFYLDTSRVLPASDELGRQALISIGCAMCNFQIAAQELGGDCEIKIKITSEKLNQVILVGSAKIRQRELVPNHTVQTFLYSSIFTRRVDRGEYDHQRLINNEILQQIENLGGEWGIKTILIKDWGRKLALAELQAQADSFVLNNRFFAEELIKDWLLENNTQEYLGMPGDTFHLNDDHTLKIKKRFNDGLGFESDDVVAMAQLGKKGIMTCGCVGMIVVDMDSPQHWVNAGRVLQHGALIFESHGISWAVHAGLAEVPQVNMLMLRPIAMTAKRPIILFRAGYLKSNEKRAPHSPRLKLEKVWETLNEYGKP